jgi:hypothetical protein
MTELGSKKDKKIIKPLLLFILFAVLFTSIFLIVKLKDKLPKEEQKIVKKEAKSGLKVSEVFKFPKMIMFNVLRDDKNIGSCQLYYLEKTEKDGIAYLSMKNFQGFGLNFDEWLNSYIFAHDSSLYAGFLLKGNKKIFELSILEQIIWTN